MPGAITVIAGIEIPFDGPVFLAIVAFHIAMGLASVVAGAIAMLSHKRPGRHPAFGKAYFWCLSAVFASATTLSLARWAEDNLLFALGALAFASALIGRLARRHRWSHWVEVHIAGMGMSYIVLLTAFYVDNGKSLPFWKELPPLAFWLIPAVIGGPILIWALLRRRLVRGDANPVVSRAAKT